MSNAEEKAAEAAIAAVEAEAAVAEKVASVEAAATDLVEIAAERAEAAEEAAQQIVDAALFTELGNQVRSIRTECDAWRAENEALKIKLSSLEATVADLSAKLPPSVLIAPTAEPPPSKGSPIPQSPRTEVVMAENPSDADADGPKGPAIDKKRRRFAI